MKLLLVVSLLCTPAFAEINITSPPAALAVASVVCAQNADALPALNALRDAVAALDPNASEVFYFPVCKWGWMVSGTFDLGSRNIALRGDAPGRAADGVKYGSILWGNFPAPVVNWTYPAGGVGASSMGFINDNAAGTAIHIAGVGLHLYELSIKGWHGIVADSNNFSLGIRDVVVHWSANTPGSIGIGTSGHTVIENADVVGYDDGIRLWGVTSNLFGGRVEVNRRGLVISLNMTGGNAVLQASRISGLSFEANDTAIWMSGGRGVTLDNLQVQGTPNSPRCRGVDPPCTSEYGLVLPSPEGLTTVSFQSSFYGGNYAAHAIQVGSPTLAYAQQPHETTWISVHAQTGNPPLPDWHFLTTFPGQTFSHVFLATNATPP